MDPGGPPIDRDSLRLTLPLSLANSDGMGMASSALMRRAWGGAAGIALAGALVGLAAGLAAVAVARPAPDPALSGLPEANVSAPARLLRQALGTIERGDSERAEELLATLAKAHPIVADYANLLRMRLLVDTGKYPAAIALRQRWAGNGSPLRSDLFAVLASAHSAVGERESAHAAWRSAIDATDDSERLAALHLELGRSQVRSGQLEAGGESLLKVWTSYPLTSAAPAATAELEAIEGQLEAPLRTGASYKMRGDALFRLRRNHSALAAYDRALASKGLSEVDGNLAQQRRGQTLFRLRRYSDATEAFKALPDRDDVRIWRARSLARAGHPRTGAAMLEELGRRAGAQATRASFLAALLWEGEGESDRARALYLGIVNRAPQSSYRSAALWRLGWRDYREGRMRAAVARFEKLEEQASDAIAALRGRYWRVRALERAGRSDAGAQFATLAREYPLSYYGWRARARAQAAGISVEAATDPIDPVEIRRGRSNLAPSDLALPRILLEAGMSTESLDELNRLFTRARGRDDRLALAQLYADAGDFHRPQRLMVDAYTESLARGPAPTQLELWWHAWPAPFGSHVTAATEERSELEPALVYAVMREESGYRPAVVSASGARGLLQLMPETAERVAKGAGFASPSVEDLLIPRINIQLGALYLGGLVRRFEGRTSAVIGSYNAGPTVVTRWLAEANGEDDEWVEDIAYDQTRSYVKRVMRSLYAYRVLY